MRVLGTIFLLLLCSASAWAFDCTGIPDNTQCGDSMSLRPPACLSSVCTWGDTASQTGTGTLSSLGAAVTGSSTDFVNQLNVGDEITAGGETRVVTVITDATHLTVERTFSPNLVAGATFTFQPPILRQDNVATGGTVALYSSGHVMVGNAASLNFGLIDLKRVETLASVSSGNGHTGRNGIQATAQTGGASSDTASAGGNGGSHQLIGGTGGAGTGTNSSGGSGGVLQLTGGGGGAATGGGGASGGGLGGAVSLRGGDGGNAATTGVNGAGGDINIDAGAAGAGTGSTGTAGTVLISTLNTGRTKIGGVLAVNGTTNPATSVGLDLQGTTKALLPSRLTTTQRDALTAVDGMVIYNSTTARHEVRQNGAWTPLQPPVTIGARAYNSGNLTLTTSTLTALALDSERFDTDTIHSTSSNTSRLTATTAGTYQITGNVLWAANAVGVRELDIKLNNTTYIADQIVPANAAAVSQTITTIYALAAADYVELIGWQNSTGNLAITATGNYSPEFMMVRLGP